MAFIETPRFPENISLGSSGGPEFNTSIVALNSGHEKRNSNWEFSRLRYNVAFGIRDKADLDDLLVYFNAMGGRRDGFRFKDWHDYKSCISTDTLTKDDQAFGTGNGSRTQWQLIKTYTKGTISQVRNIVKPVNGTILIANNGSLQTETTHYSIDYTTGIITYVTAPTSGHSLTWGGEFDVPCRFDIDYLDVSLDDLIATSAGNVPVIEIRV